MPFYWLMFIFCSKTGSFVCNTWLIAMEWAEDWKRKRPRLGVLIVRLWVFGNHRVSPAIVANNTTRITKFLFRERDWGIEWATKGDRKKCGWYLEITCLYYAVKHLLLVVCPTSNYKLDDASQKFRLNWNTWFPVSTFNKLPLETHAPLPFGPISFIFMQFLGKNLPNERMVPSPLWDWRSLLENPGSATGFWVKVSQIMIDLVVCNISREQYSCCTLCTDWRAQI